MSDTQLTDYNTYNVSRIIFAEPKNESAKLDNGQLINYKRVNMSTQNEDGTVGHLVVQPPECWSFGIQDKFTKPNGTGKTFHISIFDKEGPTNEQQKFFDFMNAVQDACKAHLLTLGLKKGGKPLSMAHLDQMSWCKFGGTKEDPDFNKPSIYAKMFESAKSGEAKVLSKFYDENDVEIIPQTLIGASGLTQCALRLESIFVGDTTYAINIKVAEAIFKVRDSSTKKRLLPRASVKPSLAVNANETNANPLTDSLEVDEEEAPKERLVPAPSTEKKVKSVKKKGVTE
jgi:hypothetical protein